MPPKQKKSPRAEKGSIRHKGRILHFSRVTRNGRVTTTYGPPSPSSADNEEGCLTATRIAIIEKAETTAKRKTLIGVSFVGDRWKMEHGESARRGLQGLWNKAETQSLWVSVQHLKLHADEFYDFHSECSDGRNICDLLLRCISSGDTKELDLLTKVIREVGASAKRQTRNWLVAKAVKQAAKKRGAVPTATEAFNEFVDMVSQDLPDCIDYNERTFRDALVGAGLDWILAHK